jgi:hypothetical protein
MFDSGNEETTAFSRMRPLDASFKSLPGQAQEARLSFVQPAALSSDYGSEALDRFRQLSEVGCESPFPRDQRATMLIRFYDHDMIRDGN